MTHRLTLSPRRARVLRWCERHVDADLVAVWSPEDKQTLAGLVADGLAMPTGSRYELTPDGRKALHDRAQEPSAPMTGDVVQAMRPSDFPPSNPDE